MWAENLSGDDDLGFKYFFSCRQHLSSKFTFERVVGSMLEDLGVEWEMGRINLCIVFRSVYSERAESQNGSEKQTFLLPPVCAIQFQFKREHVNFFLCVLFIRLPNNKFPHPKINFFDSQFEPRSRY